MRLMVCLEHRVDESIVWDLDMQLMESTSQCFPNHFEALVDRLTLFVRIDYGVSKV